MDYQFKNNYQLPILTKLLLFFYVCMVAACATDPAQIRKGQNNKPVVKKIIPIDEPIMPMLVQCKVTESKCRIHYFNGNTLINIQDNGDRLNDQFNNGLNLNDSKDEFFIGVFYTANGYEPQTDVIKSNDSIEAKILQKIVEPRVGYVIGVLVRKPQKLPGVNRRNGMDLLVNDTFDVIRGDAQHSVLTDEFGRFQLSVPPGQIRLRAGRNVKDVKVTLGETIVLPMVYKD